MKHTLSFVDEDQTIVCVEIETASGQLEFFHIDGLPRRGPGRTAIIEAEISRFIAEQTLREKERLAELVEAAVSMAAIADGPTTHKSPPFFAELLIASLAPKNSAQVQLGDLQEMFEKNVARIGERQARRKYWFEVARSLGPLLLQWGKRIGFLTVLIDYFRSKFGL